MFWYDLQQFCLFNKKVSMLGIAKWKLSKSFCVSEFGKVEESSFFRALALLKL
jgi:hypothetical protein